MRLFYNPVEKLKESRNARFKDIYIEGILGYIHGKIMYF